MIPQSLRALLDETDGRRECEWADRRVWLAREAWGELAVCLQGAQVLHFYRRPTPRVLIFPHPTPRTTAVAALPAPTEKRRWCPAAGCGSRPRPRRCPAPFAAAFRCAGRGSPTSAARMNRRIAPAPSRPGAQGQLATGSSRRARGRRGAAPSACRTPAQPADPTGGGPGQRPAPARGADHRACRRDPGQAQRRPAQLPGRGRQLRLPPHGAVRRPLPGQAGRLRRAPAAGRARRTRGLDRIYHSNAELLLDDGSRRLRIARQGSDSAVVWHPGAELPEDTSPAAARRFLCVESANTRLDPVWLVPGAQHLLGTTLSLAD